MTRQSDYFIEIISSCRGFIFLHRLSSYYIWNPSIGVERQIPLSPNESHGFADDNSYLYGFGYDELRDDYLVVMFCFELLFDEVYSHLEFFSLRDNMWHVIEGTHFPDIMYRTNYEALVGFLFNGSIHWSSMCDILAFDLIERKLLVMPFPNDFCHHRKKCFFFEWQNYIYR
jgi:F-box interacting protein